MSKLKLFYGIRESYEKSMIILVLVLLFSWAFTYICYRKYINTKCLKNISGPKPNFFFGNIGELLGVKKYEYLDMFTNLQNKFGKIYKVLIGPYELAIIVSDTKLIEYILSSPKRIDKSNYYSYLHSWIGTGLLTSGGTKWKNRRRMLNPAFHYSILENFVDVFENVGNAFIKKLEKEADKHSVNITTLTSLCTLDVICEAAMGIKLNAQDEKSSEYVKCVKIMCDIFVSRARVPLPLLLYPLTSNYYKEKKALKVLHNHTDKIIYKKMTERLNKPIENLENDNSNLDKKKRLAFLDILLEGTINGEPLSKMEIREEVDTFMFAGHDTTAAAISFTLHCLATNPEAQEKALEEQRTIFDEFKNAKTTIAHLQQMKYLELVIKESLRLYPPVPLLARMFSEDVLWGGTLYPKNLNVVIPIYLVHRDPEIFPDPEKFCPERFVESNITNPYVYVPFSAGLRNCIGQKFAMFEMKSILSKVLRNFKVLPATPNEKLKLVPNIVLQSANGVCIALKKREN